MHTPFLFKRPCTCGFVWRNQSYLARFEFVLPLSLSSHSPGNVVKKKAWQDHLVMFRVSFTHAASFVARFVAQRDTRICWHGNIREDCCYLFLIFRSTKKRYTENPIKGDSLFRTKSGVVGTAKCNPDCYERLFFSSSREKRLLFPFISVFPEAIFIPFNAVVMECCYYSCLSRLLATPYGTNAASQTSQVAP